MIPQSAPSAQQENPAATIGQRIHQRRVALGMSMEQLARLSGVSAWQTVQQWEKEGGTAPSRAHLPAVALALAVSPEYLVFGNREAAVPHELSSIDLTEIARELFRCAWADIPLTLAPKTCGTLFTAMTTPADLPDLRTALTAAPAAESVPAVLLEQRA